MGNMKKNKEKVKKLITKVLGFKEGQYIKFKIEGIGRWHYGTIKKVYKRFPWADPPYSRFDLVVKERGRKKILKYLWIDIDEIQPAERRSN